MDISGYLLVLSFCAEGSMACWREGLINTGGGGAGLPGALA